MNRRVLLCFALLAVVGGACLGGVVRRDERADVDAEGRLAGTVRALGSWSEPAAEHTLLGQLEGDWDINGRLFVGDEELTWAGTAEGAWILGGRFLEVRETTTFDDSHDEHARLTVDRRSVYGFDKVNRRYEVVGHDTLGTGAFVGRGVYEFEAGRFSLRGEVEEDGRRERAEWELVVDGKDRWVQRVRVEVGGEWQTVLEVVGERG